MNELLCPCIKCKKTMTKVREHELAPCLHDFKNCDHHKFLKRKGTSPKTE